MLRYWLLCIMMVSASAQSDTPKGTIKLQLNSDDSIAEGAMLTVEAENANIVHKPLNDISALLQNKQYHLDQKVIDKTMTILQCADQNEVAHNQFLTIIDYSLPSNQKRLWIFDLIKNKLLFHTHVSHGINSGTLMSRQFSNMKNSKASSIGVYTTEKAYSGRHGHSLKMVGLEKGFNSNAYNRFVVMHGSWYLSQPFIDRYGRPGRSWGCPALPLHLTTPVINKIENNSLLIAYDNNDDWFQQSSYLNCYNPGGPLAFKTSEKKPIVEEEREFILFYDKNKNGGRDDDDPVLTITANSYEQLFDKKAPLKRMLRRQIDQQEYIALSDVEVKQLNANKIAYLQAVRFIVPEVKNVRGYYATEMKIRDLGEVKLIRAENSRDDTNQQSKFFAVDFKSKPSIQLTASNQFIRWLGL